MRKHLAWLIIALVGAVLFAGTAFASQDEILVHQQFGVGSWATWQHEDGNWDRGTPGESKTTGAHEYSFPADKLKNYTLTRVEVKTGYSFNPEVFESVGGWRGLSAYDDFKGEILGYAPDNLSVANTHDLNTGKVDVMWSLKLSPTYPPLNFRQARDTVDANTRAELKQLGFHLEKEDSYNKAREGWLWCLPVHIAWYGVPQQAPDFSVKFDTELIQQPPGSTVNTRVTYKLNTDHDKAETAKLELFQQREDGSLVKRITPPDGVVREFQPGEAYRVPVSLQMSAIDTDIIAVIRPVSTATDRDWSDNRDELWLWPDEEAPELPSGEYVTPKEGDKIHVELGG